MSDPEIDSRDPYAIVPGEDELMARRRPGQRPVKRVNWPGVLLGAVALIGVIALGVFYAHDRQRLFFHNGRYHQQLEQALHDVSALQQQQAALADRLHDHQQRLDALPEIEPQRLAAMEVQLAALGTALRALQQREEQVSGNTADGAAQANSQPRQNLGFRLAALEDQLDALNKRVASLESSGVSN